MLNFRRAVAQLVENQIHNHQDAGSYPIIL